jgi:hypothetical protein
MSFWSVVIPIPKARGRASIWKAKLKNKKKLGGHKTKKKKKKIGLRF